MSTLNLEISFGGGNFAENIGRFFGTAFAGCILPVHLVNDARKESQDLLPGEEVEPELFATYFSGTPITGRLVKLAAENKPLTVWCAYVAGFPKKGLAAPNAYFRFAFDAGQRTERFVPIVTAILTPKSFRLTFAANGAPILPAPSRDRGGPIDQAWQRSAEIARRDLARALTALKEVELHIRGENVQPNALERLAKEIPGLIVDTK